MNKLLYPVNQNCNLQIEYNAEDGDYYITIVSVNHAYDKEIDTYVSPKTVKLKNNVIEYCYMFSEEGEYRIIINSPDEKLLKTDNADKGYVAKKDLTVYALNEDLFNLTPIRIDFHTHSNCSDGDVQPNVVVSNYRGYGMDAIAITDHHTMLGAVDSKKTFEGLDIDYPILLGEETHTNNCYPHIVNWGAKRSVCAFINENKSYYNAELERIIKENQLQKYKYPLCIADAIFRVRKIKEYGGISVLAHPFWKVMANILDTETLNFIYDNHLTDAIELISGQTAKENSLQLCYYMDCLRCNKDFPIVGSSDEHSARDPKKSFYTILLVKSITEEAIKESVLRRKTIVVENYREDKNYRVYSDFRFTRLGFFLIDYYFPLLENEYSLQGKMLSEYAQGKCDMKEINKRKAFLYNIRKELKY